MTALPGSSAPAIRAVLFDVGGPIDTKVISDRSHRPDQAVDYD